MSNSKKIHLANSQCKHSETRTNPHTLLHITSNSQRSCFVWCVCGRRTITFSIFSDFVLCTGFLTVFTLNRETYLVDATQWRDINSLTTDCTSASNTCRIFTWTGVDDSSDQDLNIVDISNRKTIFD